MQYIAPQDLKSFGLIPEIIGRLPVLTYLNPLDRNALRAILTEPKHSIIKQYIKLFEMDGIKLTFEDSVFEYIVDKAVEYKLGARGLYAPDPPGWSPPERRSDSRHCWHPPKR